MKQNLVEDDRDNDMDVIYEQCIGIISVNIAIFINRLRIPGKVFLRFCFKTVK